MVWGGTGVEEDRVYRSAIYGVRWPLHNEKGGGEAEIGERRVGSSFGEGLNVVKDANGHWGGEGESS